MKKYAQTTRRRRGKPDLKTGKEQGARRWSGNVFESFGAAALKAAAVIYSNLSQ